MGRSVEEVVRLLGEYENKAINSRGTDIVIALRKIR